MPVQPGARLGPSEILGAGGMGEVYRARDMQLKREVAIKVLPEGFSQDERAALFVSVSTVTGHQVAPTEPAG